MKEYDENKKHQFKLKDPAKPQIPVFISLFQIKEFSNELKITDVDQGNSQVVD